MSSAIRNFYAGRSVFISGASGFLGKQVVEKLLRSCSDIERIYVLIRPMKNMTSQQRIEEITKLPVSARLSREQPNFSRKIVGICGDIELPCLGIRDPDQQTLSSNVSVVIHSAANVKFRESLRNTIQANVLGTRKVMELTKSLTKPEAFVYVSTAYSNVDKTFIEEKVYDPPIEPEDVISLVKIGRYPNVYAYSKAITEKMVKSEIGDIPCAIVRPSVVIASATEPFEGWVDNSFGLNGVYSAIGSGMVRSLKTGQRDTKLDLVPVDLTANAIIAAGWKLSTDRWPKDGDDTKVAVYNVISGDVNPITMTEICTLMVEYSNMYPLRKRLRKADYIPTTANKNWFRAIFDVYVELPVRCVLADLWSRFLGQKPRLMKSLKFCNDLRDVTEFFASNDFTWVTQNFSELENSLSSFDRQEFSLERTINWKAFFRSYWLGLKEFFFKEPTRSSENISTSPESGQQ